MLSRRAEDKRTKKRPTGFSLVELLVTLLVALVLIAIGMPYFLRAYHAYRLTNAAQNLAQILRITRYEAIRLNKDVNCVIKPDAGDPTISDAFADSDGDTNPGPTEKIVQLGIGGNLIGGGGVPGTAGLLTGANVTSGTVTPPAGNATIGFDSRGAVKTGNINVFYLASPVAPETGYRAVLLMPSGSIQIWTGDVNGNWGQLR